MSFALRDLNWSVKPERKCHEVRNSFLRCRSLKQSKQIRLHGSNPSMETTCEDAVSRSLFFSVFTVKRLKNGIIRKVAHTGNFECSRPRGVWSPLSISRYSLISFLKKGWWAGQASSVSSSKRSRRPPAINNTARGIYSILCDRLSGKESEREMVLILFAVLWKLTQPCKSPRRP